MKMTLYKFFSCNVEVQYKSYLLSKAMLFTLIISFLTIILPFILAHRSRGFWLKTHEFYEQPAVHFSYEYLLIVETDDPSQPIICSDPAIPNENLDGDENCAVIEVQEFDYNADDRNDLLNFNFRVNVPLTRTISSVLLVLALDFQLKTTCPLHMQSLAVINHDFPVPPSGFKYYGDVQLYQVSHLPCLRHHIDTKYNTSVFDFAKERNENIVDFMLAAYFSRHVATEIKRSFSRSVNGHTGTMNIQARLRVPEMRIIYIPSILQELKWAWPQYLSLVFIFHWIFNKIKKFVFNNRLIMAWEVVPWKKS